MTSVLEQPVLVLNRLWQAVNICTARRALVLLCQGQACVVWKGDDGSFRTFNFREWREFSQQLPERNSVHTVSFRIHIPRVILLLFFDRIPKKEVKLTRHNVFLRDRDTCQYCGRKFDRKHLNIDHVIPRDQGGETTWENVVCSCVECNAKKGNRTPEQAGMRLIRKPRKPRWRPFVQFNLESPYPDTWKHFLDITYWNVELGEEVS